MPGVTLMDGNEPYKIFIADELDTTSSAIAESDVTLFSTGLHTTSSSPLFDMSDRDMIWNDLLASIAEGDYDEEKKIAAI